MNQAAGLLAALAAALATGVGSFLYAYAKPLGAVNTAVFLYWIGAALAVPLFFLAGDPKRVTPQNVAPVVAVAVCYLAAVCFFNLAIASAGMPLSLAATLRNLSVVVTVLLAVTILAEHPSGRQFLGMLLAGAAIAVLATAPTKRPQTAESTRQVQGNVEREVTDD